MKEIDKKPVRLGAVTIGQAPRDDMVPELEQVLGDGFEIMQAGALDDFTYEEIIERFSPETGDDVLVSKLRDGRQVVFAEKHIIPFLQEKIEKLADKGAEAILMLCTGRFPQFDFDGLIIKPQQVLHRLVRGLIADNLLGIMVPDREQKLQIEKWWNDSGVEVVVKAASPYQSLEMIKAKAAEFRETEVDILFLDCMGFTREMKEIVKAISGKNVILPRTMIAAVIRELLD